MVKLLSNTLLKEGIEGIQAARSSRIVSALFYQDGTRCLAHVPHDPDTHEDFRPTNKLQGSAVSLKDVVEQDVKENPVMIYRKGVSEFPQCGFSSLAVRVLKHYRRVIGGADIIMNMHQGGELKEKLKDIGANQKAE
ncbi:hypothetical protein SLE2022_311630 [Rubroshorea leprosula]